MKTAIIGETDGVSQRYHYNEDGETIIEQVQDVSPILDANKAMADAGQNNGASIRHAASVPMVVHMQWDKEFKQKTGLSLADADRSMRDKFIRAKLNDPDNKFFRTWKGNL